MLRKLVITLLSGALCLLVVTPALAVKYNEAPMLGTMVAAGELPPVEERLPEEPGKCIDTAPENIDLEIGRYGGMLRLITTASAAGTGGGHDIGWGRVEFLLRSPGFHQWPATFEGDILKGFEVSKDSKVYTLYLRKGMKWSDGYPFTTEDVRFWWEDIMLDEKITPAIRSQFKTLMKPDGKLMELKIIDEYTFQVSFNESYCFPIYWATTGRGGFPPAHFLKQFHPRYTPMEKLEPLIKKEGFEKGEWWRLVGKRMKGSDWEKDCPTLTPYAIAKMTPTKLVLERNPYYWKVDAAGNQLPYIDKVEVTKTSTLETATMKILAGEVDLARHMTSMANIPVYKEYADRADIQVGFFTMHASLAEIFFNLTNEDPVWREVVRDVRFRKALSLAINREEIIDAVYFGFAGLPRVVPLKEYNPEKANQLLDEIGLDKRDKDGWRLGPDGKRFTVPFEIIEISGESIPTTELVRQFWQGVGIHSTMRRHEVGYWYKMLFANELKAFPYPQHYAKWPFDGPDHLRHYEPDVPSSLWYVWQTTDGEKGEKPSAEYMRYVELYEEMLTTLDGKVHEENWNEMRGILAEQIWTIPIVDDTLGCLVFSKKLGNIAKAGNQYQATMGIEQMFFKE